MANDKEDFLIEAIKYHQKKAERATESVSNITLLYILFCSLVVLPDLAEAVRPYLDDESSTVPVIQFVASISIEIEKLKFLLTTLPLLFGTIVAGVLFSARQHYTICEHLYDKAIARDTSVVAEPTEIAERPRNSLVLPVLTVSKRPARKFLTRKP